MEENILVPLRNSDEVHGITPYLETIAKPRARVVFVVRCPVDGCDQPLARTVLLEPGLPLCLARSRVSWRWSWEHKKRLAEDTILSVCENLRIRGVNIAVNAHSGSIKRVIKNYVLYGNVNLVVVGPRYSRIRIFFESVPRFRGIFKQPAPVLRLHAGGGFGSR